MELLSFPVEILGQKRWPKLCEGLKDFPFRVLSFSSAKEEETRGTKEETVFRKPEAKSGGWYYCILKCRLHCNNYSVLRCKTVRGFAKKTVLSITSSGQIGFWDHDIEASRMRAAQEGARASARHTDTYRITRVFIHIHTDHKVFWFCCIFLCNKQSSTTNLFGQGDWVALGQHTEMNTPNRSQKKIQRDQKGLLMCNNVSYLVLGCRSQMIGMRWNDRPRTYPCGTQSEVGSSRCEEARELG